MRARLPLEYVTAKTLLLVLLLIGPCPFAVVAQDEEPSPIAIELTAPQQAGPGTVFEILIRYKITDPNANANLNYNVYGPAHIWKREPEPPNPTVNIWTPTKSAPEGTVKIQIKTDEGTEGQEIRHLVEVRWGTKVRKFDASTLIKYVPPTPTATPRPRPRATQPSPSPTPTLAQPTLPPLPRLSLTDVALLGPGGQPISTGEANQEIDLRITYTSSGDLKNVKVVIRFEPDVVNLDAEQHTDQGYVLAVSSLAAAPGGAPLFDPALKGRIRPYEDGGELYPLRVVVQIVPAEGTTSNVPEEISSEPIQVAQHLIVTVKASVETDIVKVGGSIIVHAVCENLGPVRVNGLNMQLSGLPDRFIVHPGMQTIAYVAGSGGTEERLFAVHAPENWEGPVSFKLVATLDRVIIESEPVTVQVFPVLPLSLDVSASKSTVYADEAFYITVLCVNEGRITAQNVTAKLIDTTDNLGVFLQEIGDIGPGESREVIFVVEVPRDFPADVTSSLVVEMISDDGVSSRVSPLSIDVVCVPRLYVSVAPPVGRLQGGQSAEAIVTLKNDSQCTAYDVLLSVKGLPMAFTQPPDQQITELAPGGMRYVTFNIHIPEDHRGTGSFVVEVSDSKGTKARSLPVNFYVGGVSAVFVVVFGILAVAAVAAVVVGIVLYFRHRQTTS